MHNVVTAILGHAFVFNGVDTCTYFAGRDIGRSLYRMNEDAMNARYDKRWHDDVEYTHPSSLSYIPQDADISLGQAAKSIDCLLYQCSEGDVPKSELFLKLKAFRATLNILDSHPDYQAARWDY